MTVAHLLSFRLNDYALFIMVTPQSLIVLEIFLGCLEFIEFLVSPVGMIAAVSLVLSFYIQILGIDLSWFDLRL